MKQATKAILIFGLGFATVLTLAVVYLSMGQEAPADAGALRHVRVLGTYFIVGLVPWALIATVIEVASRINIQNLQK